ncbi:MAG TPA: RDD family protein [Mycobacteriales bacterium]|nr:RDD family protein [Mycobacteriales bacterium]
MSEAAYGDPIIIGEAVALELRPAGIGSRSVAVLIDFAVQYALVIGLILISANVFNGADDAAAAAFLVTAMVLVVLGYPVGFETLWRGRTLGKAAMGLRVVRDDGGPVRFRHAFVRGLVGVVIDRPGITWGLGALLPMLLSSRSKRIGDFAAGTVVVQERVPSRLARPAMMPPPLAGWAASLDLAMVDDGLAMALRQFLARSSQLAPWAREQMGSQLLGELSRRTAPPPAGTPPWAYFSAVLAERTRREVARSTPPDAQAPPMATAPAPTPTTSPPPAVAASPPPPPAADPPPPGPFAPPG